MRYWFTRPDAPIRQTYLKRFDPRHWTIDFPRGTMGSVVTGEDAHSLKATVCFLRQGDIAGLLWESEDRFAHNAHRRETSFDYSRCQLSFRWVSNGLLPLDELNGPTLTIEGDDESGAARTWYVRLWNYAVGEPTAADIRLDFDALDGGFILPDEADRVYPKAIRRMFFSLVPTKFVAGSGGLLDRPETGVVTVSNIRCEGSGSVLSLNDAMVPEHSYRICTGYDDLYHVTPERVVDSIERLGFREVINHYVGMSHYPALGSDGLVDATSTLNAAAKAWQEAFAAAAHARGYRIIWSLSYELLDLFCPEAWKQRGPDGSPALTGYEPPSTLISPASHAALDYLAGVAVSLCEISDNLGAAVAFQVGEPWWWVTKERQLCVFDEGARTALKLDQTDFHVAGEKNDQERRVLDAAGRLLASSTALLSAAVKERFPEAECLLLTYLPGSLEPESPELKRANLPKGWASPAFDVLQLEDYEWVTWGRNLLRERAIGEATARLGYDLDQQHYLAGFVADGADRSQWKKVVTAAQNARQRGVGEVFLWALPQLLRDSLTLFQGDEAVQAFDDILFPIEIGAEATVAPTFSTAVVTSASGHEFRNSNWSQARLRFDAGPGVRGDAELERLLNFFRARRGSAIAFRFRDPYDHSSAGMTDLPAETDQVLRARDAERRMFPLTKVYGSGEVRRISRPVSESMAVAVDGVQQLDGWALREGGVIEFDQPAPEDSTVTAGFLFDVPVRFAEDQLEVSRASFRAGEAPSVPLIEVREEG